MAAAFEELDLDHVVAAACQSTGGPDQTARATALGTIEERLFGDVSDDPRAIEAVLDALASKAMLDATGSSGLASEETLRSRGYDVDPQGGYTAPPQRAHPEQPERGRKHTKGA